MTEPTSTGSLDTTDETMSFSGTAGSDAGIEEVSWTNSQGGGGSANGTSTWQTPEIPLELGSNTITITARDAAGASASRNVVVRRESGELGSMTLSWDAPTERTDGTALTNLAGFTIHYGRMSGIYDYTIEIDNPGVLTYVVENLASGEWYFSLTAHDTEGLESENSGELMREIS